MKARKQITGQFSLGSLNIRSACYTCYAGRVSANLVFNVLYDSANTEFEDLLRDILENMYEG